MEVLQILQAQKYTDSVDCIAPIFKDGKANLFWKWPYVSLAQG